MKITLTPRVIGAHHEEFRNKTQFIKWAYATYSDHTYGINLNQYSVKYIVNSILPYCYYYLKIGND